jgi:hypothetical protein
MISPASISAILETSRFIGSRSCDVISLKDLKELLEEVPKELALS